MVHYLKRNQLDIEKYDACIEEAYNSRIYAYSWYLDIVADNWDALVLNDYEAVMPLPFLRTKRYLFFEKIIQPTFCQQLGVFSYETISENVLNEFYSKFIGLKPISYSFNSENKIFNSKNILKKDNFELSLENSYDVVFNNYSRNLKRNIKKSIENKLVIKYNISIDTLIKLKKDCSKINIKNSQFKILKRLLEKINSENKGTSFGVFYNEELIATAFFIFEKKRITHLISATNSLGKDFSAIPLLFDTIIRENLDKEIIFDFEGSMIKGVAQFFKSFGASEINYNSFKKNE